MLKIFAAVVAMALVTPVVGQVMVTKSYLGPTVEVVFTPEYGGSVGPGVAFFSGVDFPPDYVITDVEMAIGWRKTAGSCAAPTNGPAAHELTSFRLDGLPGNTVLAPFGTWSGNTATGDVATVFNVSAVSAPSGTPINGTFLPNGGDLSALVGESPFGTWRLMAGNIGISEPLCVNSWSVTITADEPTPVELMGFSID